MTWVKICGATNLRDAQISIVAGADALGFVFAASPRKIEVKTAAEIITRLRGYAEMIGVFVNETPEYIAEIAARIGLTGVQLHGDEQVERLPEFRRVLDQRKIIKVLHANELLNERAKLATYLAAHDSFDAILLDSGSPQQRGGTGIAYDWSHALPIAAEIRKVMPLIIAGGLQAGNVASAIEFFEPWGVDVVSGVESRPGVKDETKVKEFVTVARQTAASPRQRG